jgi:hypothetical protein
MSSQSLQSLYYNEDLTWIPAQRNANGTTKKDGSGRVIYDTPQTIWGMLNDSLKKVIDKTGAEVVSSGTAKMDDAVMIDDKINGRIVIGVGTKKDFTGADEGRTVYLK